VQEAELPGISCFAPHIASLTSPVKVWLLPAASTGIVAHPITICIPMTAATIRFAFIPLSSPETMLVRPGHLTILQREIDTKFSCKPSIFKYFVGSIWLWPIIAA
jgi:hypothetical protein